MDQAIDQSQSQNINDRKLLWQKIKDIRVAMLVSHAADGGFHSRPMFTALQDFDEFDGKLYFFTRFHSPKVDEINDNPDVLLTYSDPDSSSFVSVYGQARISHDRDQIEELWTPLANAFFADGKSDEELCLLEVTVRRAEYWDTKKNRMMQIYEMIKASYTNSKPDFGQSKSIVFT